MRRVKSVGSSFISMQPRMPAFTSCFNPIGLLVLVNTQVEMEGCSTWNNVLLLTMLVTFRVTNQQPSAQRSGISSCTIPTLDELGRSDMLSTHGLVAASFEAADGGGREPQQVRIIDFSVVCESSGVVRGSISSISLVINFECVGTICGNEVSNRTEQFQYDCFAYTTPPLLNKSLGRRVRSLSTTATLMTTPMKKCGDCSEEVVGGIVPDPVTHCAGMLHVILA
jgi:hypothetical protein